MTAGQKDLLMNVLSSRDQFILAQGYTRSGKTTVFQAVAKAAKNIEIVWLSNTGRAVPGFTYKAGSPGHTSAKFLEMNPGLKMPLRDIDEGAVMISRDMDKMLELALRDNARVVFIGDMNQLLPTAASREFKDSQVLSGLNVIIMEESSFLKR